jgi:hypothetical protein
MPKVLNGIIFGRAIVFYFSAPHIFAIEYSPEDIEKEGESIIIGEEGTIVKDGIAKLDWSLIQSSFGHSGGLLTSRYSYSYGTYELGLLNLIPEYRWREISILLEGLTQQTVNTKWIKAEIDRITALIYFIITISVFIVAIAFLPSLLHKFSQVFQDTELVRLGVLIFSVLALCAVGYMLILTIRRLLDKASAVFKYLTALGAIKTDKEKFKGNLQEIEGYLNSGDWTLAEYWVNRIQKDYTEVFLGEVSKAQPSEDKSAASSSKIG